MINEIAKLIRRLRRLDPDRYEACLQASFADYLREELPNRELRLHYCMVDGGDGPVRLVIFQTAQEAEAREQYELYTCGLEIEDAVGSITVTLNPDGEVVY